MSMKKSKTTKVSEPEDDVDRISSLPDPILDIILSSLPTTEEVIRTSILSKRWRYLWTSVPSLDIDCSRGPKEFDQDEFKEFVNWVLLNKSGDLESFRLSCSHYYNRSTIGRWIHAAVMRKVKQLELIYIPKGYRNAMKLPHCLVTCDSLEVLRLSLSRESFTLRNFTGFSSLRVLELNGAELMYLDDDPSKCMEADFLKKFHLLEVLSLIDCLLVHIHALCISSQKLKTLRIDNRNLVDFGYPDIPELNVVCPQLVDLEYGGYIAFYLKFVIKSVKKAVIYPIDMYQEETTVEDLSESMYNFLAGVCHVEYLSINHYFTRCIKAKEDYPASFPHLFSNLKTLELRTKFDAFALNVLIHIFKRSPNLESLHFIIQEGLSTQEFQTLVEEMDEVETKRILTGHLKRVEFPEFSGEKKKLAIARFLLEHGNALEEMVFNCHKKVKNHKKMMKTINEVSQSFKASSSVRLITLFKDQ